VTERIAVISTSYPSRPGAAAGHFVQSEVKRLASAGHEVHVFAPGQGRPSSDGARVHWLPDHGAFGWPGALSRLKERPTRWLGAGAFALCAARALQRSGPFARIQAHFLVPCAWPIAIRALAASPAAVFEAVGHGSDVRTFCRLPRALRAHIARVWLARGARLRLTGQQIAAELRAASPELSDAICVEASPIDLELVHSRSAARRALAIPAATQLALIVSRLIPEKRVAVALHALALVDDLSVVVVGDGPELEPLRARFPNVRFVGYLPRPEALRWIAAADVLVSASEKEGAPSVVREARALGVPVVAVKAGDLALWAERDPGLLVIASRVLV
jgi:glycosyltransferase involved in cell wall biosynthesis